MPNEAEGSCRRYRKARAVRAEFAQDGIQENLQAYMVLNLKV